MNDLYKHILKSTKINKKDKIAFKSELLEQSKHDRKHGRLRRIARHRKKLMGNCQDKFDIALECALLLLDGVAKVNVILHNSWIKGHISDSDFFKAKSIIEDVESDVECNGIDLCDFAQLERDVEIKDESPKAVLSVVYHEE